MKITSSILIFIAFVLNITSQASLELVGILDLDDTNFFKNNSNFNNWILYPVGVWLGFKVTKTSFLSPLMDNKKK